MKSALFIIIGLICINSYAQETITLKGKVLDSRTQDDLPGATVELMRNDSSIVKATTALSHFRNNDIVGETSDFSFEVPKREATYILRCSLLGYKTSEMTISLGNLKNRDYQRELPPILMREDSEMLKEAVISATKVQFYHRGDTVVYNADAFVLAEGSMLDALVRQLPGVEIHGNGDIYYDGRLVNNLMLDGKDFFHSDKKIMLDNLPSYMVKQVEIHDYADRRSEFLGIEKPDDKEYVMDVKLKKEYNSGWITNAEAGAGVAGSGYEGEYPYLARLFSMRFTDHSQLAFYSNVNDLSDERRPGQNDGFKPENLSAGTMTQQTAGMTYGLDTPNKKWRVGGDANVSHSALKSEQTTDRTNFLSSGDTYERILSTSLNKNLNMSITNNLEYESRHIRLTMSPALLYQKFDNTNGQESETRGDTLLNRYCTHGLTRGHDMTMGLKANSLIKFNDNTLDHIEAGASVIYNDHKDDTFKRYDLIFGSTASPAQHADQYFRIYPDHNLSSDAFASYSRQLSKGVNFELCYDMKRSVSACDSRLYRLDLLSDYDQNDIGMLPPENEYETTQDFHNSYKSLSASTDHAFIPGFSFLHEAEKGSWSGQIYLPIALHLDRQDYERGVIDTTLIRRTFIIGSSKYNTQIIWNSKENTSTFRISYRLSPRTPDLMYMVNMRDDTDPLNIHEGSSGLKDSYDHHMNISYNIVVKKVFNYSWLLDGVLTDNAIVMGYTYDPASGVRCHRAQNVDGSGSIALRNGFKFRKDRFTFSSALNASHQQNVDLVGTKADNYMERSIVRSEGIGTNVNANFTFGKHAVSAKLEGDWKYVNSLRKDFTNLDIWNYNYGLTATFNLPHHFQLSTDLTMFSRRGYHDAACNTDDLVWNARLSYSAMKGNLIFMLDGFDILGQLSNVTFTLNGQGRAEIRRNVLPQYALFHVQYRLNRPPRK